MVKGLVKQHYGKFEIIHVLYSGFTMKAGSPVTDLGGQSVLLMSGTFSGEDLISESDMLEVSSVVSIFVCKKKSCNITYISLYLSLTYMSVFLR